MQRLVVAAVAMLLPLPGGCASLKHGPTERIAIETNPGGADASIVCSESLNFAVPTAAVAQVT